MRPWESYAFTERRSARGSSRLRQGSGGHGLGIIEEQRQFTVKLLEDRMSQLTVKPLEDRMSQLTVKHLEDRISQLPDGILAHILSLLEIKEAGRSSVLSHRWRDLWKFTTRLNFDGSQMLKHCHCKNYKQQRSKLVAWVKQVLKLHLRPSLDEFRVSFVGLASRTSCDIEELMNFVMTKRVKILEMDLGLPSDKPYTLSQECYRSFKSPSNLSSIKCLTSLSLRSLNLNGELIEYFLSNCPNLEQLRLFFIGQIVNLNVSGPSVQLKHLEIFQCYLLESIEFCAPKLVTFKYLGKPIRLSMGSLPLLAELDIPVGFYHQPSNAPIPFSSYLSQIETLKLHIWFPKEFPQVLKLTKLKHLMLEVNNVLAPTFPCFTSLVEAAPSLHKFTYKLISHSCSRAILSDTLTSHPHECLKDVEICGFFDREYVMYLLQIAINIEKITIHPYHPLESKEKYKTSEEKEEPRKRAHQLREILPSGVELTVL